ncbi:MAG: J domain-containing protein [Actinobacteria bacterium]|nr:J domain-containing protein [Actinomycetota bacterium]
MAPSYYDVLGVPPVASADAIRRAYRQRAREVHPDRQSGSASGPPSATGTARAMQELNEAWRVLGDPARRAVYDRSLQAPVLPRRPPRPRWEVADDDLDDDARPYRHRLAEPGDLGMSIVRGLPWLMVILVLGAIFVFTAFAGGGDDDATTSSDLVGSCVVLERGGAVSKVPCSGPSDGRVDLIAARSSLCPEGSDVARLAGEESWLCLRDPSSAVATTAEVVRPSR